MKQLLLSSLAFVAVSAVAEVKPFGTVLSEYCGPASKTLTVCTARAVGSKKPYLTLSTVKTRREIPARVRVVGAGLVVYSGTDNQPGPQPSQTYYEFFVKTEANGKKWGTLKANGVVVGLPKILLNVVFHTQSL